MSVCLYVLPVLFDVDIISWKTSIRLCRCEKHGHFTHIACHLLALQLQDCLPVLHEATVWCVSVKAKSTGR